MTAWLSAISENAPKMGEISFGFFDRQAGVDSPMFLDERHHIILFRKQRQVPCRDFGQRQFEVDAIGFPCAPVQPPMKVAPFVSVLCAMESMNPIDREVNAFGTFAGNCDLGSNEVIFEGYGISWTINSAWPVVKVQIVPDFLDVSRAFTFEQMLAVRALLGHGTTGRHVAERDGRFDRAINGTWWEVVAVHAS